MATSLALAILGAGALGLIPVGAATAREMQCVAAVVPVGLADDQPRTQSISGQLCYRGEEVPDTVLVLVHGASYDHQYWDWPVQPERYSFVAAATAWGFATFNFDRLGAWASSHPRSTLLDLASDTAVLHQVLQALRRGEVARHAFRHVIYIGHSVGAQLAWAEVATYHDVDAVIISATDHHPSLSATMRVGNDSYPANQDPQFAAAGLDSGYVTSRPGTRGADFHHASHVDPVIIAADERLKSTYTQAELRTIPPLKRTELSQAIKVPVMLAIGEFDNLHCQQPDAIVCTPMNPYVQESPHYAPEACLSVFVLRESGGTT